MTFVRAALVALLAASPVAAQSARGTWEGFAYTGNNSQKVVVVIDSASAGWKGTIVSSMSPDAVALITVTMKSDTLSFGIPFNGMTIWVNGLVGASKFNGNIWVDNNNAGTMELSRKAADEKTAKPERIERGEPIV